MTSRTSAELYSDRKRRFMPAGAFSRLLPLFFLLVVFMPVIALALDLGLLAVEGSINWQSWITSLARRTILLRNSVNLAASVSVAAMFCGLFAACRLWSLNKKPFLYLRWLVVLFAVIPPYIHALAWSTTIMLVSSMLGPIGIDLPLLGGWGGSWLVQTMAFLPLAVGLALLGLETVDPRLLEAGRIQRPDGEVLLKVAFPLAAPAILAGFGFIFIFSLMDYSIPSLFGKNVYALEIFAEHSASGRAASAFLVSAPLLLLSIAVVYLSQAPLREAAVRPPWGMRPWNSPPKWPLLLRILQHITLFLLSLQIIVPLIGLIIATGGWNVLFDSVKLARREVAFSLGIALSAALLVIPLAYPIAAALIKPGKGRGRYWLLTTLPLAIPAPLVGIGLILAWNRPLFGGVYGSEAMPVLAALARFAPFAVILILAQLRRLDPLMVDAARILQRNPLDTLFKIRMPLLAPGLLAAFCLTFALTLGELGATLIVAPPGKATVTMRLYNLLHYGATDLVAGLCLIMVLVTAACAGLAFFLLIYRERVRS